MTNIKKLTPKTQVLCSIAFFASSIATHTAALAAPPENNAAVVLGASTVTGISDSQIFQRDATNKAQIHIRLQSIPSTTTYKYYSISLLNSAGARIQVLTEGTHTTAPIRSFSLSPDSSFQKVRVSFYDANNIEKQRWNSPAFNVGEVFLVAGQSNAASEGSNGTQTYPVNSKHRAVNPIGSTWEELRDPMPYATTGAGASPWPRFADQLSIKLGVPVAVLNVAYGGTAVEDWQSTVTSATSKVINNGVPVVLFERLKLGTAALKRLAVDGTSQCDFRAVLWHQGESNASGGVTNTHPAASRIDYARHMTKLATDFGEITKCKQPWMIANATWLSQDAYNAKNLAEAEKVRRESEVRLAQRYLVNRLPLSGSAPVFKMGPDTDLLAGETAAYGQPGYRWDGAHMSFNGLALHGQLWATHMANMIEPAAHALTLDSTVLLADEADYVWGQYGQKLGRDATDMEFDKEGFRYWVQHAITKGKVGEANIALDFENSNEKKIRDTYQSLLQRRPTWWELLYWLGEIKAGRTTIANMGSADRIGFENTLTANGKKAFLLYVKVMGRNLQGVKDDMGGLTNLTNALNSGQTTEAATTSNFLASAEYRVRKAFIKTRGRQPTWDELVLYYNKLVSATPPSDAALEDEIWRLSAY